MSTPAAKTEEQISRDREMAALIGSCLAGAVASLPALLAGSLFCRAVVGRRREFAAASVVALVWCAALAPWWGTHIGAAWTAATGTVFGLAPDTPGLAGQDGKKGARERRAHRQPQQRRDRGAQPHTRERTEGDRRDRPGPLARAWPHLRSAWLLWLPLVFPFALLVNQVRPKGVTELEAERELAERRQFRRERRRAGRKAGNLAQQPERLTVSRDIFRPRRELVALGAQFDGARFLERHGRQVGMPLDWLKRHALVIGPSGSGKTETLLRLAYGAARHGWPVYYIDAKGDPTGAERFCQVMAAARVATVTYPEVRFDCWRGDTRAVYNRLLELVPFSTEGDGSWYRDIAKQVLWIACDRPEGPPRSSVELLHRLDPPELRDNDPAGTLAGLDANQIAGTRLRYHAFFLALNGRLDGTTSWEDCQSAYLLLDGLRLKEEANSLARLLVEDFADYAADRKPRDQHALLIVDEFSAIADAARTGDLIERLRSFNVAVILAPQVEEGMGDDKAAGRIVGNVEVVFCHALKRPESIIALAGTRREVEWSHQHQDQLTTGLGTGRAQHVYTIDPNRVRQLKPGECYLLRAGQAAAIKIAQAPTEAAHPRGELRDAEHALDGFDTASARSRDDHGPLP